MKLGPPCTHCGSTMKYKHGRCAPCARAAGKEYYSGRRSAEHKLRKLVSYWRRDGWLSAAERGLGSRLAIVAKRCDSCGGSEHGSYRFCADHSDIRYGGSGLFRGVLCQFCNISLGFMERRNWVGPDHLVSYLATAKTRREAALSSSCMAPTQGFLGVM